MRPAECPQDSTAVRTLVTLSRPTSVERCGQQLRLQWINGGGDIQPGSERVAGEKAECQLGITQPDWMEAQGSG